MGEVSREQNCFKPSSVPSSSFFYWPFQGGSSVAVLYQSMVSYVTFVLSLHVFVLHLFFFFFVLWKAVRRDCGISPVYSLLLYTK